MTNEFDIKSKHFTLWGTGFALQKIEDPNIRTLSILIHHYQYLSISYAKGGWFNDSGLERINFNFERDYLVLWKIALRFL